MKKITLLFLIALSQISCVSSSVFNALETRYATAKTELNALQKANDSLLQSTDLLTSQLAQKSLEVQSAQDSLHSLQAVHAQLGEDYKALADKSDTALKARIAENQELLAQIAEKEGQLTQREQRLSELEDLINAQEQSMQNLKKALSDALLNFEGKGLTVEQRNGKVYVSMENKLLFESGSWTVGTAGKEAVRQLGTVLADNPDITILIEGHTDNVPYSGKGPLKGNWDLSTKRATSIVNLLLENDQILPQNLTAAGRGEYLPVGPNTTPEGRAANRRIEVVLSPQLDEITQLLKTND
jgi:chemotaxis protein MotB